MASKTLVHYSIVAPSATAHTQNPNSIRTNLMYWKRPINCGYLQSPCQHHVIKKTTEKTFLFRQPLLGNHRVQVVSIIFSCSFDMCRAEAELMRSNTEFHFQSKLLSRISENDLRAGLSSCISELHS